MSQAKTVQCVNCREFNLRISVLARHGFGNCAHQERWKYASAAFKRQCDMHVPTTAENASKRVLWLSERGVNFAKEQQP